MRQLQASVQRWAQTWGQSLALAALTVLLLAGPAPGQEPDLPATQPATNGVQRLLNLDVGQAMVVDAPWPTRRVAVTDPEIADIQVISPRQVLVQGKTIGTTDLLLWSDQDEVWRARLDVGTDLTQVRAQLAQMFPRSNLELRESRGVLVVTGSLGRAEHVQQLESFLRETGLKYVDMTSLAGLQQVMIRVRVAEVSRSAIRNLSVNMLYAGSNFFGGSLPAQDGGTSLFTPILSTPIGGPPPTISGTISPAVTLFGGIPSADFDIYVQALAENRYLRILAEPNLVALSGEEANFLAGGEFPIPIVQGAGATTSGTSISVEYKEFGVQLRFRPVVLGDGTIRLHVAPEVSDLTQVGSVQLQGFSIPGLLTRRAETTLELKSGQTFGMAGLLRRNINARTSRIPGLGELPVLGALFRSVRYQRDETELMVLVTASLVEPLSIARTPPLPGDLHVSPNDWELYSLGRIEGKEPAKLGPADQAWLHDAGLNHLRGPGAWASYQSVTPPSQATLRPEAVTQPSSR